MTEPKFVFDTSIGARICLRCGKVVFPVADPMIIEGNGLIRGRGNLKVWHSGCYAQDQAEEVE